MRPWSATSRYSDGTWDLNSCGVRVRGDVGGVGDAEGRRNLVIPAALERVGWRRYLVKVKVAPASTW